MEDKPYFIPHLRDLARLALREYRAVGSLFLTPEELALANSVRMANISLIADGGYEEAERRRLFFVPDGVDFVSDTLLFRIVPKGQKFGEALAHRDVLGALTGRGIRREALGDLLILDGTAYVFALPSIAEEVRLLDQVGRYRVRVEEADPASVALGQDLDVVRITVASLRLDACVSEAFDLSRENAKKAIDGGLVSLNGQPCFKSSEPIKEGDRFSLKGRGKRKIVAILGETKKGKQALALGIYR